jgi:hypothetical protein
VALPVAVPIELPPVGVITLAGRVLTPASEQMVACLRAVAQEVTGLAWEG